MKKVLVVDDVYTVRLKTELVLRHAGRYHVVSVHNGAEAIESAVADPPDAIVLDIIMAGMNGIETLEMLRSHSVTCPVVAFTNRKEQRPGEFLERGFSAYVAKSDNLSSLLMTLRHVLGEEEGMGRGAGLNPEVMKHVTFPAAPLGPQQPIPTIAVVM